MTESVGIEMQAVFVHVCLLGERQRFYLLERSGAPTDTCVALQSSHETVISARLQSSRSSVMASFSSACASRSMTKCGAPPCS